MQRIRSLSASWCSLRDSYFFGWNGTVESYERIAVDECAQLVRAWRGLVLQTAVCLVAAMIVIAISTIFTIASHSWFALTSFYCFFFYIWKIFSTVVQFFTSVRVGRFSKNEILSEAQVKLFLIVQKRDRKHLWQLLSMPKAIELLIASSLRIFDRYVNYLCIIRFVPFDLQMNFCYICA